MRSRPDDAGPNDPGPEPSSFIEKVLAVLEDRGVSEEVTDRVVAILEEWEASEAARNDHALDAPDFT